MKKILPVFTVCALCSFPAIAAQPVQLSMPNLNLPAGNVEGARVSLLYGKGSVVVVC